MSSKATNVPSASIAPSSNAGPDTQSGKPDGTQPVGPSAQEPDRQDAIGAVGQTLTRMRFLIGRRIVGRMAIANVAPGLELTDLDVLDVIRGITRSGGEVTVGAIAEAMRIDPSRGSRLVADLVSRGILRRDASQEDGRRSLIAPTEIGETLLGEIRSVKNALIGRIMDGWSEADEQAFSRLFARFVDGFEDVYRTSDKTGEPGGLPPVR